MIHLDGITHESGSENEGLDNTIIDTCRQDLSNKNQKKNMAKQMLELELEPEGCEKLDTLDDRTKAIVMGLFSKISAKLKKTEEVGVPFTATKRPIRNLSPTNRDFDYIQRDVGISIGPANKEVSLISGEQAIGGNIRRAKETRGARTDRVDTLSMQWGMPGKPELPISGASHYAMKSSFIEKCPALVEAGFELKPDVKLAPRLIIHDIPVEIEKDEIVKCVCEQNLQGESDAAVKAIFLYPRGTKKHRSCVVEVTPLGIFPTVWKKALVTPLPKVKQPSELNHFRPISVTCALFKLLEAVALRQMSAFVESNRLLCPQQSGFRKHHSIHTALINLGVKLGRPWMWVTSRY
ncbi:uncharacterized protein LOC106645936 [Copidosoma floridanum]|uniref:uncharacterized protein LOC106645936 n=1 Tax=Copidosoma floridanum TaxID=29053 RepID=UPI0006C9C4A8|nr:uncharacterized protein LOC106645936 [Copidosoma floridanum]